jgi:hypothetical protein
MNWGSPFVLIRVFRGFASIAKIAAISKTTKHTIKQKPAANDSLSPLQYYQLRLHCLDRYLTRDFFGDMPESSGLR